MTPDLASCRCDELTRGHRILSEQHERTGRRCRHPTPTPAAGVWWVLGPHRGTGCRPSCCAGVGAGTRLREETKAEIFGVLLGTVGLKLKIQTKLRIDDV